MSCFEGDVLLTIENDGGELTIENDSISLTGGFQTAVALSLTGGNEDGNGTEATKNNEWWGNQLDEDDPNRKMISRFQNVIKGLSATPGNLKKAVQAAKDDLAWFIDEGIVDEVEVDGSIPSKNRIELKIDCFKDGQKLFDTKFRQNWESMKQSIDK